MKIYFNYQNNLFTSNLIIFGLNISKIYDKVSQKFGIAGPAETNQHLPGT